MSQTYETIDGKRLPLSELDAAERALVVRLRRKSKEINDWLKFGNYWMKEVAEFYAKRRRPRKAVARSTPYLIGQDLAARLGIAAGHTRKSDYRDMIEELIFKNFSNRKTFCQAAGLSESQLSHVLQKRKHFGFETLTDALEKVGFRLSIVPTQSK